VLQRTWWKLVVSTEQKKSTMSSVRASILNEKKQGDGKAACGRWVAPARQASLFKTFKALARYISNISTRTTTLSNSQFTTAQTMTPS
jgi:hypothetical protein